MKDLLNKQANRTNKIDPTFDIPARSVQKDSVVNPVSSDNLAASISAASTSIQSAALVIETNVNEVTQEEKKIEESNNLQLAELKKITNVLLSLVAPKINHSNIFNNIKHDIAYAASPKYREQVNAENVQNTIQNVDNTKNVSNAVHNLENNASNNAVHNLENNASNNAVHNLENNAVHNLENNAANNAVHNLENNAVHNLENNTANNAVHNLENNAVHNLENNASNNLTSSIESIQHTMEQQVLAVKPLASTNLDMGYEEKISEERERRTFEKEHLKITGEQNTILEASHKTQEEILAAIKEFKSHGGSGDSSSGGANPIIEGVEAAAAAYGAKKLFSKKPTLEPATTRRTTSAIPPRTSTALEESVTNPSRLSRAKVKAKRIGKGILGAATGLFAASSLLPESEGTPEVNQTSALENISDVANITSTAHDMLPTRAATESLVPEARVAGNVASEVAPRASTGTGLMNRGKSLLSKVTGKAILKGAGKLALRAVPFVGEALMAKDMLDFYDESFGEGGKEVIMKLVKDNAIDYNFFDSEVLDWKKIEALPKDDLEKLINSGVKFNEKDTERFQAILEKDTTEANPETEKPIDADAIKPEASVADEATQEDKKDSKTPSDIKPTQAVPVGNTDSKQALSTETDKIFNEKIKEQPKEWQDDVDVRNSVRDEAQLQARSNLKEKGINPYDMVNNKGEVVQRGEDLQNLARDQMSNSFQKVPAYTNNAQQVTPVGLDVTSKLGSIGSPLNASSAVKPDTVTPNQANIVYGKSSDNISSVQGGNTTINNVSSPTTNVSSSGQSDMNYVVHNVETSINKFFADRLKFR